MVINKLIYRELLKNSNSIYYILYGFSSQAIIYFISLYMSFTFSAVYLVQASTLIFSFVFVICYDFFIMEILTEFVIALLYIISKKGGILMEIAEFINHSRTVKTLT